jgi:hypothetical protein
MARTLRRPMFRIGGMAHEQRTGYMGGGMSGIMSGITPRQPDAGLTPRMGLQEGSVEPDLKEYGQQDNRSSLEKFLGAPPTNETRKEAEERLYNYDSLGKAIDTTGRNIVGYSADAAGNFVANPLLTATNFLTGSDFETTPYNTKQLLLDKASGTVRDEDGKIISTNEKQDPIKMIEGPPGGGNKGKLKVDDEGRTGDMETDLMKAYKEYAPIFEKELGVSDDDTKKSLYMNLAKFGAGLMAQPGGDLVGAIGKAAEKPLEGAGETVKEQSTAKRQAKLLALQTAIKENEGGPLDKTLKSIAKAQGYKGEDARKKAFEDYKALQNNNNTATSADTKRYAESAGKVGLVGNNIERYIEESRLLPNMYPKLVGRFNEKLPEELDEDNVGAYYVSDTGMFVRVVEEDGEVVTIAMGEPGFEDKPKKKK